MLTGSGPRSHLRGAWAAWPGDAGLFSAAGDVAIYAQNLLDGLAGRPNHFPLQQITLQKMTSARPAGNRQAALRGLGWDIESPFSSNRGELFPVRFVWSHRLHRYFRLDGSQPAIPTCILMSNAVYPNGPTGINAIRGAVANVVASLGQAANPMTEVSPPP